MGNDPNTVTMRERVRVVKTDLDNPDRPPEIVEQVTESRVTLDEAALLGFLPGRGFDGPPPPIEGARVGDE